MHRRLTAILEREGGGYVALCPEVDVAGQGDSVSEARNSLAEALALFFETASAGQVDRRLCRGVYVTHVEVAIGWVARSFRPGCLPNSHNAWFRGGDVTSGHVVMQKADDGMIAVPAPDHGESRTGALRSIIRRSGLPRSEFE